MWPFVGANPALTIYAPISQREVDEYKKLIKRVDRRPKESTRRTRVVRYDFIPAAA